LKIATLVSLPSRISLPKFSTVISLVPFGSPIALPRSSRSWTNHIPRSLVFTPGI